MRGNAALLMVDVQNDFCPGGALAVPEGHRVVEPLNLMARNFAGAGLPVFASRDWHPKITKHFKEYGGIWPPHCVQDTFGADFHPDMRLPGGAIVITKGSDPDSDSYSAFDGRDKYGTLLGDALATLKVTHLYVGGLATDYCVKATVLDALKVGIRVTVLADAIAGVDVEIGDSIRALAEMKAAGAGVCTTGDVIASLGRSPNQ